MDVQTRRPSHAVMARPTVGHDGKPESRSTTLGVAVG